MKKKNVIQGSFIYYETTKFDHNTLNSPKKTSIIGFKVDDQIDSIPFISIQFDSIQPSFLKIIKSRGNFEF